MGLDQETDMRAIFCAVSVARLTNIYSSDMFLNTNKYIYGCQNYDGGFGSLPGTESNGGYAFCAYTSLVLMNSEDIIDSDHLLSWVSHRQMSFEGGFQGRTNKLVDSCYCYWCGALIPIIQAHFNIYTNFTPRHIFDKEANQFYLLICAQSSAGGFCDRPSRFPDLYHTCYSLSSLSLSQHSLFGNIDFNKIIGVKDNLLDKNHPVYNITEASFNLSQQYFYHQN
ncbi:hypothetical protein MXB_2909, partial [Myxobolus squamalis]